MKKTSLTETANAIAEEVDKLRAAADEADKAFAAWPDQYDTRRRELLKSGDTAALAQLEQQGHVIFAKLDDSHAALQEAEGRAVVKLLELWGQGHGLLATARDKAFAVIEATFTGMIEPLNLPLMLGTVKENSQFWQSTEPARSYYRQSRPLADTIAENEKRLDRVNAWLARWDR